MSRSLETLLRQICRGRGGAYRLRLCLDLRPTGSPTRSFLPFTFIYRSSLLPSSSSKTSGFPASSPSDPSEKIASTDPALDDVSWLPRDLLLDSPSRFTNVPLVGYPVGDPSREKLQAKLNELAAELKDETGVLYDACDPSGGS
jgi:hypothetical protein